MTPKQRVQKKYPSAVSETYGANGYRIVNVGRFGVTTHLGEGRHPRSAWADAAYWLMACARGAK